MSIMTREEFRVYATQGNLIPVCCEVFADTETPVSAYWKIACADNENKSPYSFLLESVEGGENIGRYSFLGTDPTAVFIHQNGKGILTSRDGSKTEITGKDVFEEIHNVLEKYKPVELPGLPPFTGGAVGYASYDVVSEFETTVPQPEKDCLNTPQAVFMITDSVLVFDKVRHTIKIIVQAHIENKNEIDKAYDQAITQIELIKTKLQRPVTFPPVDLDEMPEDIEFESNQTREEFHEMVKKANHIPHRCIVFF